MPIADSNQGRVTFLEEVVYGTPLTSTSQILRVTSSDVGVTKDTVMSNEIRSDRMVADMLRTGLKAGGTIGYELSLGASYTSLIEAAMASVATTLATFGPLSTVATATTLTATGIGTTFPVGSIGQWVYISGFTVNQSNNGWKRITGWAAGALTFAAGSFVVETAVLTIKGRMIRNGVKARSFAIEEGFTDINQFFLYSGMRLGNMTIEGAAGQIVTGKMAFKGSSGSVSGTSTFSGSPTPATTTAVVNATSNFGSILEGTSLAALSTAIQGFSISIENGLREQSGVGKLGPIGIGYGRQVITGSLNAYFADATLYTKFLNHTFTSLSFEFNDGASNSMKITLPKVYFTQDNPNIGGIDQDVMEQLQWTAVSDGGTNPVQIQIDINY